MNFRQDGDATHFQGDIIAGARDSCANGVKLTGAAAGSGVTVDAVGDDANISISFKPKGTGSAGTSTTLTGSAYAPSTHQDIMGSTVTLTPATTVTAANGLNAFRGEVDLTSGKNLGGGATSYVAAVYGRGNIFGTVDIGSGDLAAVYGKFDLNGSTLTSGHIAPVQSNIVNPPASAVTAGVSLFYGESASGTPIGNGIELYMGAAYLMKLTQVSGGSFFIVAAVGGSQTAKLKIKVGSTDYFIPLNTA